MHNHRPALLVSALAPNLLNLRPGELPAAVCPECGCWRRLVRSRGRRLGGVATGAMLVVTHHAGGRHCLGSGQRIQVDQSPDEWLVRLARWQAAAPAVTVGASRRAHRCPQPPVPAPVFRLARHAC